MEFGELKPLFKALLLPPGGLLIVIAIGIAIGWRRRLAGALVSATGAVTLWLLSCNAVAIALSQALLAHYAPMKEAELQGVQAIVVLGGGTRPAPEYGGLQPSRAALPRVHYAAALARRSGKPVALSSGIGWGAIGTASISEAEVYRQTLAQAYGIQARWLEDRSRDTRENAVFTWQLLEREGIRRIALVTDATHMGRSVRNFRAAGFDVVPAPTVYLLPGNRPVLGWIPSTDGLFHSWYVLHEWLGLRLT